MSSASARAQDLMTKSYILNLNQFQAIESLRGCTGTHFGTCPVAAECSHLRDFKDGSAARNFGRKVCSFMRQQDPNTLQTKEVRAVLAAV